MHESYPPIVERGKAAGGAANVVIVCEHASYTIPPHYDDLGLDATDRQSHIAWDPGALGVARQIRQHLDADLIAGSVSRLLYDCNRPPEAPSAMPDKSEIYTIPGNLALTDAERIARTNAIYVPFRKALTEVLDFHEHCILITIHSFTPIYRGVWRDCEIGVLHDADSRLANAMLAAVPNGFPFKIELNVPYSATDGVTHTLKTHAISRGWPNVMLEIRSDLIETTIQQDHMAAQIVSLLTAAVSKMKEKEERNVQDFTKRDRQKNRSR